MRRIKRDERGSALIIALVFLLLFSLWLTTTLASAQSGLHISQTMRVQPARLYSADGAVEQAIQTVRYNAPKGVEGDTTCGTTATLNGKSYFVQCTPQTGSGKSPNGGSSPSLGIIALTNGAGGEVGFRQNDNGTIKIDGGLFSNSGIDVTTQGSACTGNNSGNNCRQINLCPNNAKTVTDGVFVAASNNPNQPSNTITSLSAGFVNSGGESDVGAPIGGSGISSGATISNVVGPTTIAMSATAPVVGAGKTITFRQNYPPTNTLCHPDATVHGDLRVVGGSCDQNFAVAVTFHCNAAAGDPLNPTDPRYPPDATTFTARTVPACPSGRVVDFLPGKYTDVDGLNNLMSTCGTTFGAGKIFYFHPGTYDFDFSGAASPVWTLNNPASWVIAGQQTWDSDTTQGNHVNRDPSGLFTGYISKNSTTLTATSSSPFNSSDSGKYLVGGLDMPVGAQMQYLSANTMKIVTPNKAPTTDVGKNNGQGNPAMFALTTQGQDAPCDRGPTGADHAGAEFIFSGPSQLQLGNMRFEICSPASGNLQQNAIFGATSTTGDLVAQNGCVTAQLYPTTGCAFIVTQPTQSAQPIFIAHGTVYAPKAAVSLALKQYTYQAISRGFIARTIQMSMQPNALFTDPVIFSPDFGTVVGADREMLMTACENGTATQCNTPRLRAMVRIQDHDDSSLLAIGYKVIVESWTILR